MDLQRSFSFGSEWFYYKLYTGHKTADSILTDIVLPTCTKLIDDNIIDKWFFIRYADPKNHVRLRLKLKNTSKIDMIRQAFYEPFDLLLKQDLIWKIQIDTYQRELERYGVNTMELSETLFYYDSKSTVSFLSLIEGVEGERIRWLFGLRSIDELLKAFQFDLSEKLFVMKILKTDFGNEFGMSRSLKKQLDNKFRKERKEIEHFLTIDENNEAIYAPILQLLDEKRKNLKPISKKIILLKGKEITKSQDIHNLMCNYIHMLMNRLFKSKNRLHEMVCYDFLFRHYTSLSAQNRKQKIHTKINP